MAHGRETGSGQPALRQALPARGPDLDLIHGRPSGPAACEPSRSRGRTHVSTRPRAAPLSKISLAPQGASTHVAKFWRLRLIEDAGGMSTSEPEVARDPERPCREAEAPVQGRFQGSALRGSADPAGRLVVPALPAELP